MHKSPKILDTTRFEVGEGALWDDRTGILYAIDFRRRLLHATTAAGGTLTDRTQITEFRYPELISCLTLTENGRILAAMAENICFLNPDGTLTPFCIPKNFRGRRFCDGKAGPDGRFYVGSKDAGHHAAFYRISPDGTSRILLENIGTSNGLAWSPDGGTLYYCDSPDKKLEAFDFDAKTGDISGRRTIMGVPEGIGEYDGMTVDAEGMLWCAVWGSGKAYRINPHTGSVIDSISLPVQKVSCCAFAGENLDTLVITTSSYQTNPTREPLAGCTFAVKVPVPGLKPYRFRWPI